MSEMDDLKLLYLNPGENESNASWDGILIFCIKYLVQMMSLSNRFFNRTNLVLFIITLILNLLIKVEPPLWTGYADSYDYLHQSEIPITSKDFFCPSRTANFYPRAFTVPLLYKLAGSRPERIIFMQKIVHGISTFFVCYIILLYLNTSLAKIIFILLWYLFMSWWDILGWTHTLLSESLSISFMFLWIASFLLLLQKRSIFVYILHLLITVFFSFTRDSWPYIIILFYLFSITISWIWNKKISLPLTGILIFGLVLFLVQQKTAQVGERYRLPIINNIVFRIIPHTDYLNWFEERGMPCGEKLKQQYSNLEDWKTIYNLYDDPEFIAFSNWVINNGKSTYTKFLITHPARFFLFKETHLDLAKIFAYNLGYTRHFKGYSRISQFIFPIFNVVVLLVLNSLLVFLSIKNRRIIWALPSLLIIIFACNALLLYNADSIEIARHEIFTQIAF